ncbi:MAG: hypothetical protein A4E23_00529 [Methanomethylovorans sp. PtaU1.Bin073]|jgi:hypothetical protein|nr:MAG: hypothetical protein A4E23_00529 [Methanomethylovorans sp. PtaU1.Bin073]
MTSSIGLKSLLLQKPQTAEGITVSFATAIKQALETASVETE